MNIKDQLCQAFCDAITVKRVPAGFAVGTAYDGPFGDNLGFYVVGPDASGAFSVQDDGLYVPTLESHGVDFSNKVRHDAFASLLGQYGTEFDDDTGELKVRSVPADRIAETAMRFVALLLRMQDFLLVSVEKTASAFREDALKKIRTLTGDRAKVFEEFVVSDTLKEISADVGIVAPDRKPVALFWGISDAKIMEALLLQAWAKQNSVECYVTALLEKSSSVTAKMRQRADNHLDAVPVYDGEEDAACARIVRQALGQFA
jgi:hypothetical protein